MEESVAGHSSDRRPKRHALAVTRTWLRECRSEKLTNELGGRWCHRPACTRPAGAGWWISTDGHWRRIWKQSAGNRGAGSLDGMDDQAISRSLLPGVTLTIGYRICQSQYTTTFMTRSSTGDRRVTYR